MKNSIKYLALAGVVLLGGVIFYNKVYIPKSTYTKVNAVEGDINSSVFGIGNVGAKNIYTIMAQTGGRILEIKTDEGKWVKKGDLLVLMDPVDLPQLLEESKISVQKAESEVVASQKELRSLVAQKNLALVTYKRYEKLKKQSFASQSEYDKAKADLDSIAAQIEATKAHIDSAKTEVLRASKAVKALQVKLSRYKIYAPVDGYVIAKDAAISQSVAQTQSILKIVSPKEVWVKAYIDERISGAVKVGQKANITLRSQADKRFEGYVKRIVAQSDAVTQEREVDIAFDNLPIPFYINEQAEVSIAVQELHKVVKIPSKLIVYKDAKAGVWVDENMQAHFVAVEILAIADDMTAVAGIDAKSVILTPSKSKKPLYEGAKIY
ncbi:efflux RND transporter periplasmic adaptor subunit [Sulfurimonas sp.]|uniref:efflux RND transporter periplasmic adaptor subunit n=1 Tax=Sulfurimonas sp. TaxID=2022749 RepID=UPI0026252C5A|nr:efflux RND transporter periplasmic adaptor subunit [Sulfurimonas sp.]